MKKFIAFCFCIVLGFTTALPSGTISVYAENPEKSDEQIISQTTEYLENGSYITITISEKTYQTARGTAYYKNGSKSYTLYNKDNDELCRFTVSGSFYVNPGISSSCTKALIVLLLRILHGKMIPLPPTALEIRRLGMQRLFGNYLALR